MVAGLHAGHARPDLAHHARALVAEDRREDAFAVEPVERVGVGVADAGRHDLDQHFALLRAFEVDLDDLERLLGFEGDGGAGLHALVSRCAAPMPQEAPYPAGDARIVVGRVERGDRGVGIGHDVVALSISALAKAGENSGWNWKEIAGRSVQASAA